MPAAGEEVERGPRVRPAEQRLADERLDRLHARRRAPAASRAPRRRSSGPTLALTPIAEPATAARTRGFDWLVIWGRGDVIGPSCPAGRSGEPPELEAPPVGRRRGRGRRPRRRRPGRRIARAGRVRRSSPSSAGVWAVRSDEPVRLERRRRTRQQGPEVRLEPPRPAAGPVAVATADPGRPRRSAGRGAPRAR